ncbi:hypothetical protein [Pseudoruegeria sp. HB172150]|uniref:hypothetical protein n=1 Tax=Pseudoruegeria sp. HB172150 TaxID=2721164 RepID=UPI001C1327D9|nr:hypothetical protein [Pseudoruegeria sp. HB172150]
MIDLNDEVGIGTTRKVFGVKGASDLVIKESHKPFHYSNFVEWTVWHAVLEMAKDIIGNETNPQLQSHFARAVAISNSAKFLVMERLQPVNYLDQTQLRNFPSWLNDRKPSAFGLAEDGQVKAMDYAMVNFYHVLNPLNNSSPF